MQLPQLNVIKKQLDMTQEFLGYNKQTRIQENEFFDDLNLSSDDYPVLSTRKLRSKQLFFNESDVVTFKDGTTATIKELLDEHDQIVLCPNNDQVCLIGDALFYDKEAIYRHFGTGSNDQLVYMTERVITFPAKKVFDIEEMKVTDIEFETYTNGAYLSDSDGNMLEIYDPDWGGQLKDGMYRFSDGNWQVYNQRKNMWMNVTSGFSGYSVWGGYFKPNDTIEIVGRYANDPAAGIFDVYDVKNGTVIVNSLPDQNYYDNVTGMIWDVVRKCPDLDYVCECDNRLWGCSIKDNTIYASALGSPVTWYKYSDLSTDSYAVEVGSEGAFTGCCNYLGSVLFFKENYIHKLFGSKPSNYQIKSYRTDGVREGSNDSLAIIGDTLFYNGVHGIYAYNGYLPTLVSENFGDVTYKGGHAGCYKDKYFALFDDATFCYDSKYGIWHKEKMENIKSNIKDYYGDLYFVTYENGKYYLNRFDEFETGNIKENPFDWYAESGDIGLSLAGKKWVGRILIRAELPKDSSLKVLVSYDSSNEFKLLYDKSSDGVFNTLIIPIIPQRCDHMRLRLEGHGDIKIFSITKEIESGSEH